jgi:hypothetical protein
LVPKTAAPVTVGVAGGVSWRSGADVLGAGVGVALGVGDGSVLVAGAELGVTGVDAPALGSGFALGTTGCTGCWSPHPLSRTAQPNAAKPRTAPLGTAFIAHPFDQVVG